MDSNINYAELLPNADPSVVSVLSQKLGTLEPEIAREVFEVLRREIYCDTLTGLENRKSHDKYILEFKEELRKNPYLTLSYIFLDLDRFKNINDTCGHKTGDEVLSGLGKILAQTMAENLRQNRVDRREGGGDRRDENRLNSEDRRAEDRRNSNTNHSDLIARLGGEEFVVVLKNTSLEDTYFIAQRLHNAIAENLSYKGQNGSKNNVTASIGIAQYPQSSPKLNNVLMIADNGMYQVKQNGRNGIAYGTKFGIEE